MKIMYKFWVFLYNFPYILNQKDNQISLESKMLVYMYF